MRNINRYILSNGLQVFTEYIPQKKTVSCGMLIKQGVKDEVGNENGLSHLVEHLLFKIGSKNSPKSVLENMSELEENGIYYNATTSKDYTTFILEGLSSDCELMLRNLSYLVTNKEKVKLEELENEKRVVIREAENHLNSTAQIADRVGQALWGNEHYGQMVIGTIDNIKNVTAHMVDTLIEQSYTPDNSALIIIGDFDLNNIKELVECFFQSWAGKKKSKQSFMIELNPKIDIYSQYGTTRSVVAMGFPAYSMNVIEHEYVETMKHLFTIPNSVILREIREKRGLLYIIKNFANAYQYAGDFGIYFSADNERVLEIVKILQDELRKIAERGIDEKTFQLLRKRRELEILVAIERLEEKMKVICNLAMNGSECSVDEMVEQVRNLNLEQMNQVIRDTFNMQKMCMVVLGKLEEDRLLSLVGR